MALQTPETPNSGSSATSSNDSTLVGVPTLPPEVASVQEMLKMMKAGLGPLGAAFDALHDQTAHIAVLGGELETASELNSVRAQMKAQDKKQEEGIQEIRLLLNEVLQTQLKEHLRKQVEEEIAEEIDEMVKEEVEKCLATHIPQELQDEVAEYKRQLEEVQMALHNSESRRANEALRSSDTDTTLHTIYKSNGEVSKDYPKNLKALFNLDAETAKALVIDYEISDASDSREGNLNRFMQFCGVSYQMVRTGADTRRVGLEREP